MGALVALVVACLSALLTLSSGTFLAITPDTNGPDAEAATACGSIGEAWRFTGGLGMVSVGALVIGTLGLTMRDC